MQTTSVFTILIWVVLIFNIYPQIKEISQQLNVTNCTLLNETHEQIHLCVMDKQD